MPAWRESGGVSRAGRWGIGIGAALVLALAWQPLSKLFWQLILALLLTAAALPISRRMERRFPRALAAGGAVALLALAVLGIIGMLVPLLISQISLAIAEAPRLFTAFQELWDQAVQGEWAQALGLETDLPAQWIGRIAAWTGESLPAILSGAGAAADGVSRAVLSPVLAFYFLRDREIFSYRLSLWIPSRHRKRVLAALQEMRREAGGYARGQLLVAAAVAALTALGLMLVGVPAWLVLGLLMGVCELIPYVGPLIGGIPIVLFSLPQGISTALWGLGVAVFVQQVEGYFLSPRLMAGATGLHPVYVLLLLSAGGMLFGLPGMIAAIPAFVCVRGAARVLYESRKSPAAFFRKESNLP